jgi:hypothetical protein
MERSTSGTLRTMWSIALILNIGMPPFHDPSSVSSLGEALSLT